MTVSGTNRVMRGGNWNSNARNCRSANRNNATPDNRNNDIGFRVLSTWRLPEGMVHGPYARASGHVQVIIQCRQEPDK